MEIKQYVHSKSLVVISDVVLRVFVGVLFALAGFAKLTGLAGTSGFFQTLGFPLPALLAVIVGVIELVGGILLVLGIKTDIVATLLAAIMFVALVTAHKSNAWAQLRYPLLTFIVLLRYIGTSGFATIKDFFSRN